MRIAFLGFAFSLFAASTGAQEVRQGEPNVPEFRPIFDNQTRAPALAPSPAPNVEIVASGLQRPWGIALLPGGGYLVTERTGSLRHVSATGTISAPLRGLPDIFVQGQGGLLDVKVGPSFGEDRLIYWTYSKPVRGGSVTAAARGRLSDDLASVENAEDIFLQNFPARRPGHYGSRIVFDGPHAFVTTGDRQSHSVEAQNIENTVGTVVRILHDGRITTDNPFVGQSGAEPSIWSYGHRNIQGALVHPETGDLWTIEHGPKGGDELNRVKKGGNHGWPVITYGERYNGAPVGAGITQSGGMEQPVYYWDPVIAPGDMTVYTGSLFKGWQGNILVASLRPGGMVRLKLEDNRVVGEERLVRELGRVRDVAVDTDGSLLLLTDDDNGAVVRLTP